MKILIVNSFYDPNIVGGAENSTQLLAEGLSKKNIVKVFTIDSLAKNSIEEKINGVELYRSSGGFFHTKVRLTKKGSKLIKLSNKLIELYNFSIKKEFKKLLKEFKPDIIHTNNVYGISPLIWKWAYQNNITCVHTIRDYWIVNPKVVLPKKNNLFLSTYQSYFRKYSNYVSGVTAPSKFTLNNVMRFSYFKNSIIKCIPNSIDLDYEKTREIINEKRLKNDANIQFLYVGVLEEHKGIMNLLEAFSKIENKYISLTICGDGKLKEVVISASKNDKRISYKGKLTKDEVNEEYKNSDVLIIPSIWDEPFGRVVIEANQFGTPVIGANKAGIKEILENMNSGVLFQYDDVSDLIKKINDMSNRDHIKQYYDAILKNINQYSTQNQIKQFEQFYSIFCFKKNEVVIK